MNKKIIILVVLVAGIFWITKDIAQKKASLKSKKNQTAVVQKTTSTKAVKTDSGKTVKSEVECIPFTLKPLLDTKSPYVKLLIDEINEADHFIQQQGTFHEDKFTYSAGGCAKFFFKMTINPRTKSNAPDQVVMEIEKMFNQDGLTQHGKNVANVFLKLVKTHVEKKKVKDVEDLNSFRCSKGICQIRQQDDTLHISYRDLR